MLPRQGLFIGVELLLFPDVDLILCASRKHVEQFPVVMHGRDSALGESIDRLLLWRRRDRNDLKPGLREQGLFLSYRGLAGAGGLTCWH